MREVSQADIAKALGVTRARANQIERAAMAKFAAAVAAHPRRAELERFLRDRLSEDRSRHPLDRDR